MSIQQIRSSRSLVCAILALAFIACTDGAGTGDETSTPGGCQERIDSTSRDLEGEWRACEEAFASARVDLKRVDIATRGFVQGRTRYWFSGGEVDSMAMPGEGVAVNGGAGRSAVAGRPEHPVTSLYRTLSTEFCAEGAGNLVEETCAQLLVARFDRSAGLPAEIHVRYVAPAGVDVDGITDWYLDSASWNGGH